MVLESFNLEFALLFFWLLIILGINIFMLLVKRRTFYYREQFRPKRIRKPVGYDFFASIYWYLFGKYLSLINRIKELINNIDPRKLTIYRKIINKNRVSSWKFILLLLASCFFIFILMIDYSLLNAFKVGMKIYSQPDKVITFLSSFIILGSVLSWTTYGYFKFIIERAYCLWWYRKQDPAFLLKICIQKFLELKTSKLNKNYPKLAQEYTECLNVIIPDISKKYRWNRSISSAMRYVCDSLSTEASMLYLLNKKDVNKKIDYELINVANDSISENCFSVFIKSSHNITKQLVKLKMKDCIKEFPFDTARDKLKKSLLDPEVISIYLYILFYSLASIGIIPLLAK